MGSPAGSAGSGNPIRKRAGGSTTCSVEVLFVSSRGSSDGDWWFCCVRRMAHWPFELAENNQ